MGRIYDHGRVRRLANLIQSSPGRTISDYANTLGRENRYVKSVLAAAERVGFLFAEDERGRLSLLSSPTVQSFDDEIARQYASWRRSGLSLWRYGKRHGISDRTLRYRFTSRGYDVPPQPRLRLTDDEIARYHAAWQDSGVPLWRYEREHGFSEHQLRARFRVRGMTYKSNHDNR